MDFFSVLTLIGGLSMFLYGMDIMGDGLKKLSGSKLEIILGKLTSNRFKGFLLGLIVTAVIQSSGATTVMLVGFVNSGIMKLGQTLSITMGANVGTTVTAWILSLSGISGESFWIRILKPTSFTPILAAIGIIMRFIGTNDKQKNIGAILLGFSVLMFGMNTMSSSMEGLKDSPHFSKLLVMFENPVMGIIVGFIFTAIIQSSSASVGVLQALSITGAINFSVALPIILGENIGAALTPLLSAITGNTDAKRVAAVCMYIKIISVVIVAGVFYILNAFIGFEIMNDTVGAVYIAVIHTLFNLISTIILMPFCNQIEKLAKITVKRKTAKKEANALDTLDERFLSMPGFAVEKCRELICGMAKMSNDLFTSSAALLKNFDKKKAQEVLEGEELVDKYEDKVGTYLVQLASTHLPDNESRRVTTLLHVIGDVERIADHAVNVVEAAQEIEDKTIEFSEDAQREIDTIFNAVCEILSLTTNALTEWDLDTAKKIEPLEQIIDKLKYKIKNNHIKRLRDGNCTVVMGFVLSDLLTNCERVSDHCSNIAVCLLDEEDTGIGSHEYLSHVKQDGENEFFEQYEEYKQKYTI